MDLLTLEDFRNLTTERETLGVSLFIPTHRIGSDVQQDRIRLRNQINRAEQILAERQLRTPDIEALLQPANDLFINPPFWQHLSDGLALFFGADLFMSYRLPLKFEPLVTVGNRFLVKPLFQLFNRDGRFFILALSQNQVRLLEGTRYTIDEVYLDDMPTSLADALRWDYPEKQLQLHTSSGSSPAGQPLHVTHHGHGSGGDGEERNNLLRFFHKLDAGLKTVLKDEQIPLVLAGVDYLLPIFREASSYKYLMEAGIPGNPENWHMEKMQRMAWEILAPYFQEEQQAAIQTFAQLEPTPRAASDLDSVLPAAVFGRVELLFIPNHIEVWGRYEGAQNRVTIHSQPGNGSEDLLNLAAIHTFINGGQVYTVEPDQMPIASTIAAVLRY